jgi:hypothetical protein
MQKHTIGRAAGFVGAAVLTAGLVGVGVGLTGAYFQDTETGQVTASTGEVDVESNAPMNSSFGPLMPGGSDSNTYTFTNRGTDTVDLYLGSANWQLGSNYPGAGNPGTTLSGGVITLVNSGGLGTSYEWPDLSLALTDGSTSVGFQWRSTDVSCGGGVPRMFVQGGAYNTHDVDPAGPLACGSAPDGDGWRTVSQTLPANVNGEAGHVGIVNDNPSDLGTIQVRNVVIGGTNISSPATTNFCSVANSNLFRVRVNSTTHDSGTHPLCDLPTGDAPILFAEDVPVGQTRNVDVTLSLDGAAQNDLANKFGTSTLVVIATQANQAPTLQADQSGNDA